jgi:hypothetical protein
MIEHGDRKRKGVSFIFLILLGIGLGMLFKNVRIGLLIGLVLGLLSMSLLRRR